MPFINRKTRKQSRAAYEAADQKRRARHQIYNSARWRRLSLDYINHHPVCEICHNKPAVDVHHIDSFTHYTGAMLIAKAYDPNNLMALCKECHANIHHPRQSRR